MRYHFTGAKCCAISDVGSKTRAFFMYVTNMVTRAKMTKKMSFLCERERTAGATIVAMFYPNMNEEAGPREPQSPEFRTAEAQNRNISTCFGRLRP
jgi:hypothetical protein